jgi:hypothetical protein
MLAGQLNSILRLADWLQTAMHAYLKPIKGLSNTLLPVSPCIHNQALNKPFSKLNPP